MTKTKLINFNKFSFTTAEKRGCVWTFLWRKNKFCACQTKLPCIILGYVIYCFVFGGYPDPDLVFYKGPTWP